MKNITLLVDSSYLLKRSINGAKNTYTKQFGHIGGLYSFFTTIRSIIGKYQINKIILVWDGEGGGIFRHNIDLAYKANRKNKDWYNKIELSDAQIKYEKMKEESILKQRIRIKNYAEELFFHQIEVDKVEADDLIAKYVIDKHNSEEIYIYSADHDYLMLLEYDINIILGNINKVITKGNFFFEFGYHPLNSMQFKIICGDSADNIKGINGWGEKTILNYFPDVINKKVTINEMINEGKKINEDRIKNKKKPIAAIENLINGRERLITNYKLVCLHEPILTNDAIEELSLLEYPLSPENRGSSNLLKYMIEDGFLSVYGGDFINYVKPFYTVIMSEKTRLEEFYKKK